MPQIREELKAIIKSVKVYMEAEKLAGLEQLYLYPGLLIDPGSNSADEAGTIQELVREVNQCQQCPLHKTKQHYVFGDGSLKAKLVFVGEAPGQDEDEQGLPFVGRAGQLLTKIIQAMGYQRSDVYICNVLKCRPPQNRSPLPSEILACSAYLHRQLELIKPKVICCLGKHACAALFSPDLSISKIRGSFLDYRGIKLMPTFHPAYLLRNPEAKKLVWQDMQKIMKELNSS